MKKSNELNISLLLFVFLFLVLRSKDWGIIIYFISDDTRIFRNIYFNWGEREREFEVLQCVVCVFVFKSSITLRIIITGVEVVK